MLYLPLFGVEVGRSFGISFAVAPRTSRSVHRQFDDDYLRVPLHRLHHAQHLFIKCWHTGIHAHLVDIVCILEP